MFHLLLCLMSNVVIQMSILVPVQLTPLTSQNPLYFSLLINIYFCLFAFSIKPTCYVHPCRVFPNLWCWRNPGQELHLCDNQHLSY